MLSLLARVALPGVLVFPAGTAPAARALPPVPAACTRDAGLTLPEGFCAVVVAQGLGNVRQLAAGPSGELYAALSGQGGGILRLRDTNGDGAADRTERLFEGGGTGIAVKDGYLWFATPDRLLRWKLPAATATQLGTPEVIVTGMPTGGHREKTFTFLGGDTLIVNFGSETNSCQVNDRAVRSPGHDPCTELEERAGLWRFSSARSNQRPADGVRHATGLRNAMALAVEPTTGKLFASPHGRDQLSANWGFTDQQNAELPSEEFMLVEPGDDFGWPYCYYDQVQRKKVLAPEYGGDGRATGRCAGKKNPLIGFPGHWAPMAILFASGTQFPEAYRRGAFIAFHGSWNRAPLPQQGYRVVFAPFGTDGKPTGQYQTFATASDSETGLRPAGLAWSADGGLYIGNERNGTIWKVMAAR